MSNDRNPNTGEVKSISDHIKGLVTLTTKTLPAAMTSFVKKLDNLPGIATEQGFIRSNLSIDPSGLSDTSVTLPPGNASLQEEFDTGTGEETSDGPIEGGISPQDDTSSKVTTGSKTTTGSKIPSSDVL